MIPFHNKNKKRRGRSIEQSSNLTWEIMLIKNSIMNFKKIKRMTMRKEYILIIVIHIISRYMKIMNKKPQSYLYRCCTMR